MTLLWLSLTLFGGATLSLVCQLLLGTLSPLAAALCGGLAASGLSFSLVWLWCSIDLKQMRQEGLDGRANITGMHSPKKDTAA